MNKSSKLSPRAKKISRTAGKVIGFAALAVFCIAAAVALTFLMVWVTSVLLSGATGGAFAPSLSQTLDILLLVWLFFLIGKLVWK